MGVAFRKAQGGKLGADGLACRRVSQAPQRVTQHGGSAINQVKRGQPIRQNQHGTDARLILRQEFRMRIIESGGVQGGRALQRCDEGGA